MVVVQPASRSAAPTLSLVDVIHNPGALRTVFQPILDLRHGRIYGYEALTRGPSGSRFESPVGLFRLAR